MKGPSDGGINPSLSETLNTKSCLPAVLLVTLLGSTQIQQGIPLEDLLKYTSLCRGPVTDPTPASSQLTPLHHQPPTPAPSKLEEQFAEGKRREDRLPLELQSRRFGGEALSCSAKVMQKNKKDLNFCCSFGSDSKSFGAGGLEEEKPRG